MKRNRDELSDSSNETDGKPISGTVAPAPIPNVRLQASSHRPDISTMVGNILQSSMEGTAWNAESAATSRSRSSNEMSAARPANHDRLGGSGQGQRQVVLPWVSQSRAPHDSSVLSNSHDRSTILKHRQQSIGPGNPDQQTLEKQYPDTHCEPNDNVKSSQEKGPTCSAEKTRYYHANRLSRGEGKSSVELSNKRKTGHSTLESDYQRNVSLVNNAYRQYLESTSNMSSPQSKAYKSKDIESASESTASIQRHFGYEPGKRIRLDMPEDELNLSPFQCLLRKQIYIFATDKHDLQACAQGRNNPICLGQVGIVCKYCSVFPPGLRASGSAYFPKTIAGLYTACQNMSQNHFLKNCPNIPNDTRTNLQALQGKKSIAVAGRKQYWVTVARNIGITASEKGLFFTKSDENC